MFFCMLFMRTTFPLGLISGGLFIYLFTVRVRMNCSYFYISRVSQFEQKKIFQE